MPCPALGFPTIMPNPVYVCSVLHAFAIVTLTEEQKQKCVWKTTVQAM